MILRKFKINDYEIRSLRGIKDYFRRNKNIDLTNIKIDNIENCYMMMGFGKKIDFRKTYDTLLLFSNNDLKGNRISSFIKEVGSDIFCPIRYMKYLEYRKINVNDSNSEKFWLLKYGDNWKYYRDKMYDNRPTPYEPEYISEKYSISLDDAKIWISEYKKNKNTSLDGFIKRHGEEKGNEMFNKFQETSKHTKEKYIKQLGKINGEDKWKEYIDVKKKTSKRSIEYWLELGYDHEQAEELRKEFHRLNFNTSSVEYWILKGLNEIDAEEKVKEIFRKKTVFFSRASKESLKYFDKLKSFFDNIGMNVMLGIENNHEITLYDKINKKLKFYDFCVPDLKLIIEYNGERYHPNPEKLSKLEWDEWGCIILNNKNNFKTVIQTADEKYKLDQEKKQLAINNYYDYLEIWSSDTQEYNWNKIKQILKIKGIKYEN